MNNKTIFEEWWGQFLSPWTHLSFTFYFFGFVVAIGGVGIYPSLFRLLSEKGDFWGVSENVITYSIALIMPACVQVLLSVFRTDNKVSLVLCSLLLFCVLPLVITWLSYTFDLPILCFVLLLLSWFVWVVANHDNADLFDETFNEKVRKESKKNHGKKWD